MPDHSAPRRTSGEGEWTTVPATIRPRVAGGHVLAPAAAMKPMLKATDPTLLKIEVSLAPTQLSPPTFEFNY